MNKCFAENIDDRSPFINLLHRATFFLVFLNNEILENRSFQVLASAWACYSLTDKHLFMQILVLII